MTCQLKAIVAVCDDWGIGRDGDMVVSNRADMRHFVACTKGHPVIMGRKTLESFPGGRPLKDRRNIVLTRDDSFAREGVEVVHSVDEALAVVADEDVAWVIGGGAVYEQFLPYCAEAEVTRNHAVHPADTFFPNLDEDPAWKMTERQGEREVEEGQGDVGLRFEFVTYCRKGNAMQFKMAHTEIHVLNLEASLDFYERALGLVPVREKGPEDGSWKLVFLGNESSDHLLELTWNRGRVEPYNQGGRDIHLAFEVDDMDAAHELHESMGCIVKENPSMGIYFIEDPDGFYIEIVPAR